ncbi:hypothetical protein AQUCO_01000150v1 [Aquilegia coerulea]|uniref:shikimate kinase n=1 Tax=Aquilegia coerulea TaxID=218851 RepID=A0A2G5E8J7_AQUCA|nr:hypothetical protein AQUCO_01000150v1 [Aquilegia coerulea]
MEVGITCASTGLHKSSSSSSSSWIVREKCRSRGKPNGFGFFRFFHRFHQTPSQIVLLKTKELQCREKNISKFVDFQLWCYSSEDIQAPAEESETNYGSIDEALILKKKSQDVAPHLRGNCIYLVGMMGSGKTTVGKILAEVLGYSFFDSDKLVEQAVGASSVAQIFLENSEDFFRNKESEVLRGLSFMSRLVVATGGGAVIEEKNWNYMRRGITVWLDVPLEALARRIAAVGTNSRPLLCRKSGDAYTNALEDLSELSKKRGGKYANANTRVCLENIASKLDLGDISDLTPTAIAVEALIQIEDFLMERWATS